MAGAGAGSGFAMSGNADEFIAKWQARWPEWGIATAFVPAAQRDTAFAWFALLQELTDAAWGGADPTPGLAKLAWWNEELRGWAKGGRRHPLGEVLQARPAPWDALAAALLPLQASRELPPSADPAQAGLDAIALAVAGCEEALFGTGADAGANADAIAFDLLAERRLTWSDAGEAGRLPGVVPAPGTGTRPRRLQSAFIRERLRRASAGQDLAAPPLRSLWLAWRAARGTR
ncbi:phytoene synthase [Luteimonas lutimaris]|uniref:Phytoene synthase n=2 Tax=Luteimonas lutimaris TaxID=698645 RepID=A0ABP7MVC0_9GAMM